MRFIKGLLGGLIGTMTVWVGLYFFFHFDTWLLRLSSIALLVIFVHFLGKTLDKFFPLN